MANVREIYGFLSWPMESVVENAEVPINWRMEEGGEFRLLNRYPMPFPKSYEDVYQSRQDADIRISVRVVNCESFDEARERLLAHLSGCAARRLPQITEKIASRAADIVFGAADGSGHAISAVRGNALVLVSNIGTRTIDLTRFYENMDEGIRQMR